MNHIYFAKIWIMFDGDLFKVWNYLNRNTSVSELITLYRQVKRRVKKFPTLKLKKKEDCWPQERAAEIERILGGDKVKSNYSIEDSYLFKGL